MMALWVLMHINEIMVCDTPTSPFVKEEKGCAFKRPSYTGIPELVSCMSLRERLIAACGQSLNSVLFLCILGPSFAVTVCVCTPSPPSS